MGQGAIINWQILGTVGTLDRNSNAGREADCERAAVFTIFLMNGQF